MSADRVEAALRGILAQAESAQGFREAFVQNYKDAFTELFVKLSVQARSRKETGVRNLVEQCWTAVFGAGVPFPKLPQQEQKLIEIFPGTSISDALKLAKEHEHDKRNIQVVLKFLEAEFTAKQQAPMSMKTLKACNEVLLPIKHPLSDKIREQCTNRMTEIIAQEKAKAAEEERRKKKLMASKDPAAARALGKMDAAKRSESPPAPTQPKRPQTQEEWEREYLKRARMANEQRELEEERSRKAGKKEDLKAAKESTAL